MDSAGPHNYVGCVAERNSRIFEDTAEHSFEPVINSIKGMIWDCIKFQNVTRGIE